MPRNFKFSFIAPSKPSPGGRWIFQFALLKSKLEKTDEGIPRSSLFRKGTIQADNFNFPAFPVCFTWEITITRNSLIRPSVRTGAPSPRGRLWCDKSQFVFPIYFQGVLTKLGKWGYNNHVCATKKTVMKGGTSWTREVVPAARSEVENFSGP